MLAALLDSFNPRKTSHADTLTMKPELETEEEVMPFSQIHQSATAVLPGRS